MNETMRTSTTERQSPSLFDKWHGIFYMPSRIDEAGHTKAFDYPVAELPVTQLPPFAKSKTLNIGRVDSKCLPPPTIASLRIDIIPSTILCRPTDTRLAITSLLLWTTVPYCMYVGIIPYYIIYMSILHVWNCIVMSGNVIRRLNM